MNIPDQSEWVPTSLCENPIRYSPKDSLPDLRDLILIRDIIVFFSYTHTVFTGVSYDIPGYYIISLF